MLDARPCDGYDGYDRVQAGPRAEIYEPKKDGWGIGKARAGVGQKAGKVRWGKVGRHGLRRSAVATCCLLLPPMLPLLCTTPLRAPAWCMAPYLAPWGPHLPPPRPWGDS